MRIQQNMLTLIASDNLKLVTGKNAKKLEKLSTGYQINRSADDAAGLQISEKMRSRIRGLTQANQNVQEGISLIQVADGAMGEIHSMLQRMNELSVKAASDIHTEDDRGAIQEEVNQLWNEVNSITEQTEFNGIKVLQGTEPVVTPVFGITGSMPAIIKSAADGGTANSTKLGALTDNYSLGNIEYTTTITGIQDSFGTPVISVTDPSGKGYLWGSTATSSTGTVGTSTAVIQDSIGNNYTVSYNTTSSISEEKHSAAFIDFSGVNASNINDLLNTGFHTTCNTCSNRYSIKFVDTGDKAYQDFTNYIYEVDISGATSGDDVINRILDVLDGSSVYTDYNGNTITTANPTNHFTEFVAELDHSGIRTGRLVMFDNREGVLPNESADLGVFREGVYESLGEEAIGMKKVNIQAGADAGDKIEIMLANTWPATIGLGSGLNVMDNIHATTAISMVSSAVEYVSRQRNLLGVVENRLEKALELGQDTVITEHSSESSIRDADMAKEMVDYSANRIIMEAGQSILAQSRNISSGILTVLG